MEIAAAIWYFLKIRKSSDKPILEIFLSNIAVEPAPMSLVSPASVSPAPGYPPEAEFKRERIGLITILASKVCFDNDTCPALVQPSHGARRRGV